MQARAARVREWRAGRAHKRAAGRRGHPRRCTAECVRCPGPRTADTAAPTSSSSGARVHRGCLPLSHAATRLDSSVPIHSIPFPPARPQPHLENELSIDSIDSRREGGRARARITIYPQLARSGGLDPRKGRFLGKFRRLRPMAGHECDASARVRTGELHRRPRDAASRSASRPKTRQARRSRSLAGSRSNVRATSIWGTKKAAARALPAFTAFRIAP